VPDLSKGKSPEKGEPSRVTNLLDVLVIKILERAQGGHGRGWRGPQIDENRRKDRRILVGSTREGSGWIVNLFSVKEERADLIVVAHLIAVVQSHIQLQSYLKILEIIVRTWVWVWVEPHKPFGCV
jgi:hypothetical protein